MTTKDKPFDVAGRIFATEAEAVAFARQYAVTHNVRQCIYFDAREAWTPGHIYGYANHDGTLSL